MSPRRRLIGRTTSTGLAAAAVALFAAGCADGVTDGVEACALLAPPHVRVEDARCDRGDPAVGRYVMQLPPSTSEENDDGYYDTSFVPIIIGNVGSPLPMGATGPRSGFVRSVPDPAKPGQVAGVGRVSRVPAVSAGPGSTISRGGLGVAGVSGSGGS